MVEMRDGIRVSLAGPQQPVNAIAAVRSEAVEIGLGGWLDGSADAQVAPSGRY